MQTPAAVQKIIAKLQGAGFEAFAVGGCVRDVLLGRVPVDWDVATSATPAEIQRLFPKHFYENRFGTVTVLTGSDDPTLKHVEVTPYRIEAHYSDQRHPDAVKFTDTLTDDLARRDFTVNAMALNHVVFRAGSEQRTVHRLPEHYQQHAVVINDLRVIDPFGGLKDLNAKLIRAVGDAAERFAEDALRLLRAVRLAAQLGFMIEEQTLAALTRQATAMAAVSQERVRDEVIKLVMSERPEYGFNLLQQTGLLNIILPELEEGVGVEQNKHHKYTVFEHSVKSLQFAAQYGYPVHVRLAALLHDVGKPRTRRWQRGDYTFYGHDVVGARMAEKLMRQLRFSNELTQQVTHLIRHHMFYYDIGKVTEAGARRLLRRVGREHFNDLIKVRIAERKGSGVPKAEPYRLRHLQFLVDKASQQPVMVGQLAVGGTDLMAELQVRPGPLIGGILNALLAEVLDDPKKNTRDYLLRRAVELKDKDPAELKALGEVAKDEAERRREADIRRKYRV